MVEIYDRPQQHRSSPGRAGPPWFAGGLAGIWQLILVVLVTAAALWLLGHLTALLRCLGSAPLHRQVLAWRRFTRSG
jgi:hypothetical protein